MHARVVVPPSLPEQVPPERDVRLMEHLPRTARPGRPWPLGPRLGAVRSFITSPRGTLRRQRSSADPRALAPLRASPRWSSQSSRASERNGASKVALRPSPPLCEGRRAAPSSFGRPRNAQGGGRLRYDKFKLNYGGFTARRQADGRTHRQTDAGKRQWQNWASYAEASTPWKEKWRIVGDEFL